MKKVAIAAMSLILGGCGPKPMTNDEIIRETKK